MERVGVIGLGIMGKPMARNLARAGFKVTGTDVDAGRFQDLEQDGIVCVDSVAELSRRCECIVTLLPSAVASFEVYLGSGGIAAHAAPGVLAIEMSSVTPQTARQLHAGLADKGIRMLDAPVSGGEPKAVDGTLAVMAGGDREDFERALPVLKAMSASVIRVGEIGAGSLAKLANQIIVGVNIAALAEAFALAAKAGVDPALVFEAVRGGLAGSAVMEAKGPMMLERNYAPGARMEIHMKDFDNVLETAHSLAAPVPLTAQVMEMMQSLRANGLGQIDHGGLVRFYELAGNLEVKKQGG